MEEKVKHSISRRKFVAWTSSIVGATAVTFMFQSLYLGSFFKSKSAKKTAGKSKRNTKNRSEWSKENIVLNTKTKVIHFPTKRIFRYYGKIDDKHSQIIAFDNWKEQLNIHHFNKDNSGIILEKLALKELVTEIDIKSLNTAKDILTLAFTKNYVNQNKFNWRIYDLLLTTIVLNSSLSLDGVSSTFKSIISNVDFKNVRIPKKNSWLKSQEDFDNKILHLQKNSSEVSNKISKRANLFWSV